MATGKSKGNRKVQEGFEELFRRLEETVTKLEEGGLTLEQSLALYEEGMQLARRCQELLDAAELRVRRLRESFSVPVEPIEPDDELPDDGDAEG
ncbi:MAG: exodeoxyribonuclease VII small subunit [Dehalococcoidia bacterium]|jgi:exodeoxyribonuclease VII small subunit